MDLALLQSVYMNASSADMLANIKRIWIDLEGRCRILLAAFVLDIHHSMLFQQEPCIKLDVSELSLPYPYSAEIWDCRDVDLWRDLMTRHMQLDLRHLANGDISSQAPLDAFQFSVFSCYQVRYKLGSAQPILRGSHLAWHQPPSTHFPQAYFMHHALFLSTMAPVHALLIVSSGSWLFNTKVSEKSVWQAAKVDLRTWIATDDAARSVWHACQLLRLALSGDSLQVLPEQWCMYLAVLICWAYGFVADPYPSRPIPDAITSEVAVAQAWEYLSGMNVRD